MGYLKLDDTIEGMDGDRITLVRSASGRNGFLTVAEIDEDDGRNSTDYASVILSPLQLRALAALCLIQAEEIERDER